MAEAASAISVRRDSPSESTQPHTRILPEVSVPALSNITVLIAPSCSSAAAFLMRMPSSAPRPVPAIMAVGVASPSAHGQEITSTHTADFTANAALSPNTLHRTAVASESRMTSGTNMEATRSAVRAIGALVAPASSTSARI